MGQATFAHRSAGTPARAPSFGSAGRRLADLSRRGQRPQRRRSDGEAGRASRIAPAQALRGAQVCVPRSELPPRDDAGFLPRRLDRLRSGEFRRAIALGTVQHFVETPAQVLMVVRGAQEFWIPAVPQYLRRVDLQARRVVVDWEERGRVSGESHAYCGRDFVSRRCSARRWRTAWSAGGGAGVLEVEYFDPRDDTPDVHRTVDDRSYGGGPGMVLKVEPLRERLSAARWRRCPPGRRRVYLGADGVRFDQERGARGVRLAGLDAGGGTLRGRRRALHRARNRRAVVDRRLCSDRAASCRRWW